MATTPPDMKVRISAGLRQRIEDAAKRNNRTMNGEIVARLEKSFEPATTKPTLALTDSDYEYIAARVARILQQGIGDEDADATRVYAQAGD